jgi:glycine/D-amino acid oxidase-like deaminating enzyme/nitrite reductase/ring-hydroxylating ferredoxin subunit
MENNINNLRDGNNLSIWQTSDRKVSVKEEATELFDTLIIGGGITGMTTALQLQRQGQKCILAEAQNLGFGTTGGTTAHLNTFLDASYPEIDSDFGEKASAQLAGAAREMINIIKSNIDELGIDADFEYKDAYLFSQNEKKSGELDSILSSSKNAGVDVSLVSENGLSIPFEKALCFKSQARFHPIKYILGLSEEFLRLGGKILEHTFISKTEFKDNIHYALSKEGTIKARNLVYATHIPPGINILSLRNAPYRSYVVAVTLQHNNYPQDLYYDMQEPYHYIRAHEIEGKNYLIIGGEDHKTGHDDPLTAFNRLEAFARENFEVTSIDYRWSSQYYVPVDGLPYIGQLPGGDDRTFVATGFNGNGMILGSLSAVIITDLILGKKNEFEKLLSPSRLKPVSGFAEFVKENADVAYHFIADRFSNEVIRSTNELRADEGRIVSFEGKKLALHKNVDGKITALNPVCTHAGCIVNWNPEEKSWDCPCHGGRFSTEGKVLTGPARDDLDVVPLNINASDS